jgi:predicted Zn-ribbon and HTH transcriptional regulator
MVVHMKVSTKMDQRAGGHRWSFTGGKCADCGMTDTQFADTKAPCPGPQSASERITVPDDDFDE